jgi:hypothetical protein
MVLAVLVVALLPAGIARALPVLGHVDDFKAAGVAGWGGGTPASNPGSGGVDGDGDGYLLLSNAFAGNFGTKSGTTAYMGDFTAAGINLISFYLNDVQTPQSFSLRLLIVGGFPETTWQYNTGFAPPNNQWQRYSVSLTDETQWTRIIGTLPFAQVLSSVTRIHFRHDLPPYAQFPDAIAGTLGIDNIELAADCNLNGIPDRQEPDTDQDGVIDACDACPNTVSGSPIDAQGCPPPIPGDFDSNGAVDRDDLDFLVGCTLGPAIAPIDPLCASADFDDDSDVDQSDFGVFQRCYHGAGQPADPACAG